MSKHPKWNLTSLYDATGVVVIKMRWMIINKVVATQKDHELSNIESIVFFIILKFQLPEVQPFIVPLVEISRKMNEKIRQHNLNLK